MITEVDLAEYLEEIRNQVCSRCVERPPGGPPCGLLGKECGVELHLPELIRSIHEMDSPLIEPYLEHNRCEICAKCAYLDSSICPCPMDYLAVPIVQAVETVDKRREMLNIQRCITGSLPAPEEADFAKIARAYDDAAGRWTGCDWPTRFGASGLDLNGWTAAEAKAMADEPIGPEQAFDFLAPDLRKDWSASADLLKGIEQQAAQAQAEAALALVSAKAGEWPAAMKHARRAYAVEFASGRPLWRAGPLTWGPFYSAIRSAATCLCQTSSSA
jgi:hypothetical protein